MAVKRYLVALLAALALLAAACGDDGETGEADADADTEATDEPESEEGPEPEDEPESEEGPEPEEEPEEEPAPEEEPEPLTASFRGVTETEIHLGIGINDAREFGVEQGDKEAKWLTAIDAVNEAGGVLGRMLVPHVEIYPSTGAIEQEAACIAHTEDIEVFAFVGEARQNNELCYTELHDTIAINAFESTEETIGRSNGLLFSAQPSAFGVELLAVEAAAEAGLIEGQTVFVHARAEVADLIPAVRAAIEEQGGIVLGELVPNAPQGDVPAIQAEADAQLERVRTEGGSVVYSISDAGITSAGAAKRTGSDVTIITTFASGGIYVSLGYTPDDINLEVFSPVPLENRLDSGQAGIEECIARFEEASGEKINVGVTEPSADEPDNLGATVDACKAIDLFVEIATAAGANLTNDSFTEAAAGLGEFDLVGALAASLEPGKYAADDSPMVRLVWDTAAQDFVIP